MRSVESTVTWTRRDSRELTSAKRRRLAEVAQEYGRVRAVYVAEYWDEAFTSRVLLSPRSIVEDRRRKGWASSAFGPHQNKIVLESALSLIKSGWGRTLLHVRRLVYANPTLTSPERRWLAYVMRWPNLLQDALDGRPIHVREDWAADLEEGRLAYRLRRLVRRYRQAAPRLRADDMFEVDTNLYRTVSRIHPSGRYAADRHFRGAWLAISGLTPRERILVPLAGGSLTEFTPRTSKANSRPRLRIRVTDHGVIVWIAVRKNTLSRQAQGVAGLDKGYKTLLTVSTGDPDRAEGYGVGHDVASEIASRREACGKQRRRLAAYERSIRNTAPDRARRIRRRNLSGAKEARLSTREKLQARERVNRALNDLFRTRRDLGTLHVERLDFLSRRLSRQMNRRLGRWLKGHLQKRLTSKAKLNGVELRVVNAAYTSQTCPACWYTSADNRKRDRFECRHCGVTGSADAIAATNVLRRGSDLAITRFTPPMRVKQILDERWRSARIGRAWGSNEGDRENSRKAGEDRDPAEPRTTAGGPQAPSGPFTRMFSTQSSSTESRA